MNAKFQTRRDFIKTTAIAAASVPLVGAWLPNVRAGRA